MPRAQRRRSSVDTNYWIGYTDLLSNSLLILLLTVAVTAVAKANRETPPLIPLTEKESFRFAAGSYTLSNEFKTSLNQKIPGIRKTIDDYRINSIEVVGHTDGQPSPGQSNLDLLLPSANRTSQLGGFQPGSNTDLGLLRAVAVSKYLRSLLDPKGNRQLVIRPYSASSLINNDGNYDPADTRDRPERRRIEIRFTRQSAT